MRLFQGVDNNAFDLRSPSKEKKVYLVPTLVSYIVKKDQI